ncbi:MAG: NAD(P)/FAD-dependent oxidoreductase [Desulfobacterales bacterium]|jgi:2,4-dienoyl-CoA reductase-like NADH-dependent reductase (Old Yellow Enzyme family)/thioredoxin reductase
MNFLFSPFRIKTVELTNRIVLPPLASFLIENGGTITEKTIEHYRLRAAGGPAMVIMEACAVSAEGIVSHHQARIDKDRHIEGLAKIADVIRAEGSIPAVQLHHAGRQTSEKIIGQKPVAPSGLACPTIRGEVEPLTIDGIHEIVKKFADGAMRAREAGFELIEVHGAHGYLINQFLSGFSNIREDAYGGNTVKRTRFAKEIVEALRKRLGDNFPISFKISAQEFVPDGLTVAESIEILQALVGAGIDIVQVSAGNDATPEWICQPMFMKKACLADSAAQVKKALDIPVMAVGRINDPVTANKIIESGNADLVCIGRGLMADPEMPKKAREGRLDEIRICIACNTCMQSIFRKGRLECLVNPALGREKEMKIKPAESPKKVMVVGGGPGGLNTAWVAAKRGHDVHLYEKQPVLGGQLVPGSKTEYKREMHSLIKFQKTQIDKYGVRLHLNHEVTPDTIKAVDPDVVILATGSLPSLPDVEGIEKANVLTFDVVLNGNQPSSLKTVIIGGGSTGCEVAYHLSESGSQVTIVEMLPKVAKDLESMTKKILLQKLRENGVNILTEHKLAKVQNNGVELIGVDDNRIFVEADKVIIAIGIRPDTRLYDRIKALGYETHLIGDCLEPRTAKAAIYDAAVLGRSI